MSVESIQTVSMVLYIIAGIFLVVSVALFLFLQIPRVVGDLTGRSARKGIENIRRGNASGENVRNHIRINHRKMQQEVGSTEKFKTEKTTKLYEIEMSAPTVEIVMELEFCSSTEIIE